MNISQLKRLAKSPIQTTRRKFGAMLTNLTSKLLIPLLGRHGIDFIFRDRFGILTRRLQTDNIAYILTTRNSCDAAPLMEALDWRFGNFETCFDIGANIGIVSAFLSQRSKIVYAFEPEPNNRERLRETLALNRCRNVVISDLAISNRTGGDELYLLESYGHHSLGRVTTSAIKGSLRINVTTIDDFCEKNEIDHIDFLKVDVEGFEEEVFEGAKKTLENKKIDLIAFEISQVPLASLGKNPEAIFRILTAYGYGIESLTGEAVTNIAQVTHCDLFARPLTRIDHQGSNR